MHFLRGSVKNCPKMILKDIIDFRILDEASHAHSTLRAANSAHIACIYFISFFKHSLYLFCDLSHTKNTGYYCVYQKKIVTLQQILKKWDHSSKNKTDMTEYEKMVAGKIYNACDAELLKELNAVKVLCQQYNNLLPTDFAARNAMLRQLLGQADQDTFINQPFFCDYGRHIRVGKRFFANFGLTVLDEAFVTIGDDCFIGPGVHIYTACHSTDPAERATRREWAEPVTIGNSVWIGGNVTILPGVTIGDNCTIGAGSVVTHSIPANSIAAGNPAKVIKKVKNAKPAENEVPTPLTTEPPTEPKIQAPKPASKAEERAWKMVLVIGERLLPRRQIIADLGLKQKSRAIFINNYWRPAYELGYIDLTYSSIPSKPEQTYHLTQKGLEQYHLLNPQK